jgi:hypothetical protein
MAINFQLGTYNLTSADSPLVIEKGVSQKISIKALPDAVATLKGNKFLGSRASDAITLTPNAPITIEQGLGVEEITITITSGVVQLLIL